MTFFSNLGVAILAELIKWSNPWYIWDLFVRAGKRIWLYVILVFTVALFVLVPASEENASYRLPALEEFLVAFIPDPPTFNLRFKELPPPEDPGFPFTENFEEQFPMPEEVKYQVAFWKDIFGRYTSRQIVIHDSLHFQLVYHVIDLDKKATSVTAVIKTYRRLLSRIAQKEREKKLHTLTDEEKRVYNLFEMVSEKNKFAKAASREMRAQTGQRDRFIEAIQRSGLYQAKFLEIFQQYGIPAELVWLPFVESYFNYKAYSRAGAAGMWQFIPSTARLYGLRMDRSVDERYDPFKSADSAARLLKANYEMFQSWPLALSAYHHGNVGIMNAVKQLDTKDIGKIITTYRGRNYGFYSRNYYPQFLAVVNVMREAEKNFGTIGYLSAVEYDEVNLESRMYLNDIARLLDISTDDLAMLNRDLKSTVLQSKSSIPKHFAFKVPPGKKEKFLSEIQTQAKVQ